MHDRVRSTKEIDRLGYWIRLQIYTQLQGSFGAHDQLERLDALMRTDASPDELESYLSFMYGLGTHSKTELDPRSRSGWARTSLESQYGLEP